MRAKRRSRAGKGAARPRRAKGASKPTSPTLSASATLRGFQARIEAIYGARDRGRGLASTFMWFTEEVGELSRALRSEDRANLAEEFADVLAWLVTLASLADIDVAQAANKYLHGCPRCRATPCACPPRRA